MSDPLMSTTELAERLGEPNMVVLDCSVTLHPDVEAGFVAEPMDEAWQAAHIPGSRYCDLSNDLSDPDSDLRFMMPTPEYFATAMASMGVSDDSIVVLYDRRFTMWATRVWWMLRANGFDNAYVLDGGWSSWEGEGRDVEGGPATPAIPGLFTPGARPGLIASADDVMRAVRDTTCIINSLSPENHDGSDDSYGRPGHIPGAGNVFALGLVDPKTHRYRPLDDLRSEFEAAGVGGPSEPIITYCGGGIAATSDAFVLTMLGYNNVAVYDGSLSEWTRDDARPLEVET
ncbi:MAG: thiosulfate/3-mercaptopyruvate sulfurtransferase [Candidatus Poriferisodalaceae bacterium]|jgi:thiosulfate/3-mercaptopyruvate sulfurtransferase